MTAWSSWPRPQAEVDEAVRRMLAGTRHRLAAAFPRPARVAAKGGSLVGVVRNEIGVIEYPNGRLHSGPPALARRGEARRGGD